MKERWIMNETYNLIMDSRYNPLKTLPRIVSFQLMTILAYMWSVVFTISIGSYFALWPTILGHTAVLVGVFFTGSVFSHASKEQDGS